MRKFNLFTNWFDSEVRPEEFDYCLKKNLNLFDRVINLKGRPTFRDFFEASTKFPEDVNVIANLDIYFDETLELAQWITPDEAYCLTRWEDDLKGNIITFEQKHYGHPGEWSQDAWIITGTKILDIEANFRLGDRGCDNHLVWLFNNAGFQVSNPSMDIKAIHVHNIDRNASMGRGERVGDGKYLNIKPSKL